MASSSLLIIVTFLAGSAWGPQISTQSFSTHQACETAMNAIAEIVLTAAKTNVNGEVLIEKDNANGLKIAAGVHRRLITALSCQII